MWRLFSIALFLKTIPCSILLEEISCAFSLGLIAPTCLLVPLPCYALQGIFSVGSFAGSVAARFFAGAYSVCFFAKVFPMSHFAKLFSCAMFQAVNRCTNSKILFPFVLSAILFLFAIYCGFFRALFSKNILHALFSDAPTINTSAGVFLFSVIFGGAVSYHFAELFFWTLFPLGNISTSLCRWFSMCFFKRPFSVCFFDRMFPVCYFAENSSVRFFVGVFLACNSSDFLELVSADFFGVFCKGTFPWVTLQDIVRTFFCGSFFRALFWTASSLASIRLVLSVNHLADCFCVSLTEAFFFGFFPCTVLQEFFPCISSSEVIICGIFGFFVCFFAKYFFVHCFAQALPARSFTGSAFSVHHLLKLLPCGSPRGFLRSAGPFLRSFPSGYLPAILYWCFSEPP